MKNAKLIVVTIFLIVSLFVSVPAVNSADYFPLSVGNRWVYFPSYGANGNRVDTISGEEIINGIRTYIWNRQEAPNDNYNEKRWIAKDDSGVKAYQIWGNQGPDPSVIINPPWMMFKADPHVGDTFIGGMQLSSGIQYSVTYYIESVSETVTVPAGSFTNCVRIRALYEVTENSIKTAVGWYREWYAPNIGPVIYAKYNSNWGSATTTQQLTSVSITQSSCTYTLSPQDVVFTPFSNTGSVGVTVSSSECSWTATSSDPWLTITSGNSGTGSGTVDYKVSANTGFARTGTITIGGQTFTITQASANAYFDMVQKIYIGYYQRPADPAGLIYWAGRLDRSGGNLNEIIEAFANSAESQALYGAINSTSIGNVLEEIYQSLLGRPADTGGKDYYVAGFNAGRFTAATIMLNLIDGIGPTGVDRTTFDNKLAAANLFTRTIDPELDGTNFQVTYAGEGDAIAARNFIAFVTSNSTTVPTQSQTTALIRSAIANPGDPILTQ